MTGVTKTILIIGAIGVAFMIFGNSMGGHTSLYLGKAGFSFGFDSPVSENVNKDFSSIEIQVGMADVEFIPSDRYGYEIDFEDNSALTHSIQNGKLKINESFKNGIKIFNFNTDFSTKDSIKIYYPKNAEFDSIVINTGSGSIIAEELISSDFDLKLASGRANIDGGRFGDLNIALASGKVEMDNIFVDDAEIVTASGNVTADEFNSNNLKLTVTSGNVDIKGNLDGKSKVTVISGKVTLSTDRKESEYNRDVSITSGNLYVNNEKANSSTSFENARNNLSVKVTSGKVYLNFK